MLNFSPSNELYTLSQTKDQGLKMQDSERIRKMCNFSQSCFSVFESVSLASMGENNDTTGKILDCNYLFGNKLYIFDQAQ